MIASQLRVRFFFNVAIAVRKCRIDLFNAFTLILFPESNRATILSVWVMFLFVKLICI